MVTHKKFKPKKFGLKAIGRQTFMDNLVKKVAKVGFVEIHLKKGGDISSVDVREALGSVLYEIVVFSEPDGSEKLKIAKKRKQNG